MLELTTDDLTAIAAMAFFAGVFASMFLSRLLEIIHTWRIVQEAVVSVVWMLVKMVEDLSFLQELKSKQMHDAGFTEEQIRQFQKVDDQFLTNWKDTVIVSLVKRAPRHFKSMLPFHDWSSAMRFLNNSLKGE
tara:strand:- start:1000 stop:1398 length:399 start_codon:yes stop_codon:yes gene_type:complete